ncbi:MAG: cell division protein FtsA [Bdellovibrionales bacterium]|nr:cell division protein FtsA [Bdellovibrionales bacterium]
MSKYVSKKDFVVGLDIGTTKVCCIVGEVNHNKTTEPPTIDIVGFGQAHSTGLRKGVVINIDSTVEAIKKAVKEAENMAGIKINSAYVGIAGTHIKSFNSSGVVAVKDKEIQASDVQRVIDAAKAVMIPQDREVLHVIPQEFIVDDQDGIREPVGMNGVRLEAKVHIVTGAISSAQNLIKCANKAGISVTELCLQPIASAEAVLTRDEKELGVALVDIGGGTTDIAIFREGALLYTSVLPVGGVHLTNDISVGIRASLDQAERIKVQHGCAMASLVKDDETIEVPAVGEGKVRVVARKILAEIVEARVEEMFSMIQAEINKSGYADLLAAGIVLTGGTTLLQGMVELGDFLFEMPLKRGVPIRLGGLKEVVNSPKYSTAVGLLKYGADQLARGSQPASLGASLMGEDGVFGKLGGSVKNWMKDLF